MKWACVELTLHGNLASLNAAIASLGLPQARQNISYLDSSYAYVVYRRGDTEPYSDLQFFRILETVFLSCDDVGCYTTVVGEYKNDRPKLIRENYSTYEYYRQMCIEEIKSLWMETIP